MAEWRNIWNINHIFIAVILLLLVQSKIKFMLTNRDKNSDQVKHVLFQTTNFNSWYFFPTIGLTFDFHQLNNNHDQSHCDFAAAGCLTAVHHKYYSRLFSPAYPVVGKQRQGSGWWAVYVHPFPSAGSLKTILASSLLLRNGVYADSYCLLRRAGGQRFIHLDSDQCWDTQQSESIWDQVLRGTFRPDLPVGSDRETMYM